jgi:5-oxopent-3-ene-1,2,5-tricarboxylate decarboxylase/2-hydroxyhepta-2,4-diene-1,7-dioate isomerase
VADPANFLVEVRIDGELKQSIVFSQLVRPAQQLLADVGEFMTLAHGDVLMLGCDLGRPLARAGQRIDISAPGFETLSNTLVKEAA